MKRAKIGLFGGTFDPPHFGHLILASEAAAQFNLSQILWMLAPDPPHKLNQLITPLTHRLEMLRLAAGDNPLFEISLLEVNRPGPHYTVDTLRLLRQQLPEAEIVLLLGEDSLRDLPKWRAPAELVALADQIGVLHRRESSASLPVLEEKISGISQKVTFIHALLQDVSSSELRSRVAAGGVYRYYLPAAVYEYIEEHQLYRNPSNV